MSKAIVIAAAKWATFLTEYGVSEADAQTAAEYRIIQSMYHDCVPTFFYQPDAFWLAFIWPETPEGHQYWLDICKTFEKAYYEYL